MTAWNNAKHLIRTFGAAGAKDRCVEELIMSQLIQDSGFFSYWLLTAFFVKAQCGEVA